MAKSEKKKGEGPTDLVKKILTLGVGTVFLTEETLRKLAEEVKLPRELLTGVLESANRQRREFLDGFTKEALNRVMSQFDAKELLNEVLRENEVEVNIKVTFKEKTAQSPQGA